MVERRQTDNSPASPSEGPVSHEQNGVCVFCEIIRGDAPASRITEGTHTLAIAAREDGYPLVITRKHVEDIFDPELDTATQQEIGVMVVELGNLVKVTDGVGSVTIISNNGTDAGQEVPHLHFHVMPRLPGDRKVRLSRGNTLSRDELDARAQNYAIRLQQLRIGPPQAVEQ